MTLQLASTSDLQREHNHRTRINRALRLLRRVKTSAEAGDPVPPLAELARLTGLAVPQAESNLHAIDRMIAAAEAERKAINRRMALARALADTTPFEQDDDTEEVPRVSPAPPVAAPPAPPASPLDSEAARLAQISPQALDGLPYGAILLDTTGRIVRYNDTESRLARLPAEAVLGRNFFTEVAPCTRVRAFEGRFRDLAAGVGPAVVTFDFTFPFPFGAQHVSVLLTRGTNPGTVLLALLRK